MPEKEWIKPQLIVLVRGKPEERVLAQCKSVWGSGSNNYGSGCFEVYTCAGLCQRFEGS